MNQLKAKLNAYERLMRLDKPIGILLLLWPTLWALWIAGRGHPHWGVVWVFVLGTILMRSAGCVMNDYADRNFDGHVARTKLRPLVTGEVSGREALMLAAILCLVAFGMVLFLNWLTVQLSMAALFLAITYPFTKRFISLPQAYLGVAFGFGIPMAFAAELDHIPDFAWWLLLANVFWALAYDTEYAMVDRDDDIHIGIRSSALFFGKYDVLAIMICYGLMLSILTWLGINLHFNLLYFLALFLACFIIWYHYILIRHRQKSDCFKAFLHNNWVGAVVFMGLIANYAIKMH